MNDPILGKAFYLVLAEQLGLPTENVVRCTIEMDYEDVARIKVHTLVQKEHGDEINVRQYGVTEIEPPRKRRGLKLNSTYNVPETK